MGTLRTTRTGHVTVIDYKGPFFTKDPWKTFKENVKAMFNALGQEGAEDVRAQIGSYTMPYSTGWTLTHVTGRTKSLTGKEWAMTAVVSVPTSGLWPKEAIARCAAKGSIERRFHPFRMTKNRIRRSRKINVAELLKGVA